MTQGMARRILILLFLVAAPFAVQASARDPALQSVFERRSDLRAAFHEETWEAIPDSGAGWLLNLEDWAYQFGWQEDSVLATYAPDGMYAHGTDQSGPPQVTADAYLVMDRGSGLVLAERGAATPWPIASLTKLMTASLVFESEVSLDTIQAIQASDDVGGAKLYVDAGATFTVRDLLYATLVGSANNAANAVSHAGGLPLDAFVEYMNEKARSLGLSRTSFVDPTGMEPGNVSTAREMAAVAAYAFGYPDVRRFTSTTSRTITVLSDGTTKRMINTNWMLWKPEYDDIFVMAGKTGYLEESGWNLVVSLRPELSDETHEVLLVLFGSDSRAESFQDAEKLARWTWASYDWVE